MSKLPKSCSYQHHQLLPVLLQILTELYEEIFEIACCGVTIGAVGIAGVTSICDNYRIISESNPIFAETDNLKANELTELFMSSVYIQSLNETVSYDLFIRFIPYTTILCKLFHKTWLNATVQLKHAILFDITFTDPDQNATIIHESRSSQMIMVDELVFINRILLYHALLITITIVSLSVKHHRW